MFYYLPWVLLVALGLWLSLVAFTWAMQSGQFSQQDRARYLPLRDERIDGAGPAGVQREIYYLAAIFILVTLSLVAALLVVLMQGGR